MSPPLLALSCHKAGSEMSLELKKLSLLSRSFHMLLFYAICTKLHSVVRTLEISRFSSCFPHLFNGSWTLGGLAVFLLGLLVPRFAGEGSGRTGEVERVKPDGWGTGLLLRTDPWLLCLPVSRAGGALTPTCFQALPVVVV